MSEIAARYVSVYPRIATGFASEINAAVGKGVSGGGKALGVGMEKAAKDVAPKIATKFTSVLTPIFTGVGIMAVTRFVKSSVDSFNQFEDASDAAAVTFGSAMKKVDALAATSAKTLGMSKTATIEAATSFGVYANSAGLAGDSAADFSIELTRLGADMASFKGTSPERAIEAIGAALRGEMEPIRYFGVTLDDASLRARALKDGLIATTKEALTPQQKILAAHALILEKTTLMQGNFNDTAELGANVGKTLEATSADLAVEIGGKLQPAIVSAQRAGISLIDWTIQNEAMLVPLAKALGTVTLAVGGLVAASKGIEALKSARETLRGIGDSFSALSTKAKIATVSLGAVGAVLVTAAAVYGVFAQRSAEAKARVEDFTSAIEADNGALGENVRLQVSKSLQEAGALDAARQLGIGLDLVTSAVLGEGDAMQQVTARIAAQSDQMGEQTAESVRLGEASRILTDTLGDQNAELTAAVQGHKNVADAAGETTTRVGAVTSSVDVGRISFEDYTKAINGSYNAQLKLAGSERAAEAAIDEGAERIKEWTAELTKKYEEEIKADAAAKKRKISDEEAGKQAEKRAAKEVKAAISSGKALDINTDAGRRNEEALHAIADTTLAAMVGMTDLDIASGKAAERAERGREQFLKLAEKMGVSAEEAENLAEKLGLVKSKTVDMTVNVKKTGVSSIQAIPGKGHQLFTLKALAGGGGVFGGIPGKDSVPALLMPDEHVLTTSDVKALGGHEGVYRMRALAQSGVLRFASGGPVMPTYKGHSLEWWDDYLLTDLEGTRLRIRIDDLKADLKAKETYYTGKGKKRKKKKRKKLRDLRRTEAQQELAEAEEQLELAKSAAKANALKSGTIADRLAKYQSDTEAWKVKQEEQAEAIRSGWSVYDSAAGIWQSAASSLGRSSGISLDKIVTQHSNRIGDKWSTSREVPAADLAAKVGEQANQVTVFIGLLDQLRKAGASEALISDVMALGTVEGTKAARMYLADRKSMAIAESAYAKLAAGQARLNAIGDAVGTAAVNVTINEAATPEATKQAVLNALKAGRT